MIHGGQVKIGKFLTKLRFFSAHITSPQGDFGLARLIREVSQPLSDSDKTVVTLWYRAPELILGAKDYTGAVGTAKIS